MQRWEIKYQLTELPTVVKSLRERFPAARIFALTGDLGAGKTTLVSEFCRQLGVTEGTSSPTFSIVSEYLSPKGSIYHLDCYRLQSIEEALDIGVEDYLDQGYYCFVEWPSLIEPLLPLDVVNLRLEHTASGTARTLTATTPTA
ncbi:MAG: tRNA (adenosine(37)-N6)-threonylcarbamoyltransferase complex ATPase subunit type 1 TsaE [Bacteroidota bacterium]